MDADVLKIHWLLQKGRGFPAITRFRSFQIRSVNLRHNICPYLRLTESTTFSTTYDALLLNIY